MKTTQHILLVEDNPMDVDLALRAFQRRKLTNIVDIARDGEEALAWMARIDAGEPEPAVILLDLKLPRVDGHEVLRAYKSHPRMKHIPIVVLTTSAAGDDVRRAYELGANSYIVKPVDFDKFVEMASQIDLYWTVLNRTPE